MAQLAEDGFLRFKYCQFYPTNSASRDRDSQTFIIIMEKVEDNVSSEEIRRNYLIPLG